MVGGLTVPAGILAYSITFAISDTLCEIWGEAHAQLVVRAGILVQLIVWLLIMLAIQSPAAPFWTQQEAFAAVLGGSSRIILASLTAYIISQSFDVWLFGKLKAREGEKRLWLRNNLSTLCSQLLDTLVFIVLAFAGTGAPLIALIMGQLTIKYLIALLDTPVVYALVYWLRRPGQGLPGLEQSGNP